MYLPLIKNSNVLWIEWKNKSPVPTTGVVYYWMKLYPVKNEQWLGWVESHFELELLELGFG